MTETAKKRWLLLAEAALVVATIVLLLATCLPAIIGADR